MNGMMSNGTMSNKTIREAWKEASCLLSQGGIEEAQKHAELLIEHLLDLTRTEFLLRWDEPFPRDKDAVLAQMIDRRLSGEPVQYIIGEQEFYGLPFYVNPSVLIPRPETELLVEAVMKRAVELFGDRGGRSDRFLEQSSDRSNDQSSELSSDRSSEGSSDGPGHQPVRPHVLDIGTGSGAIVVTLAAHCPGWRFTASDISEEALQIARRNASRHQVADRIDWICGDLLTPWLGPDAEEETFDIIVSNPPYIVEEEIGTLQVEVRQYEPHLALSGGDDGLRIYDRLIDQLRQLRKKPRIVALETGQGQHEAVMKMLESVQEWDDISVVPDLAGIMRHVVAVRTNE